MLFILRSCKNRFIKFNVHAKVVYEVEVLLFVAKLGYTTIGVINVIVVIDYI